MGKTNVYQKEIDFHANQEYAKEYMIGIKAYMAAMSHGSYNVSEGKENGGKVYTPPWIIAEMNELAKQNIADLNKTCLDLCCGSGNILMDIMRRRLTVALINKNAPDGNDHLFEYTMLAINNCFAADIDDEAVYDCLQRAYLIIDTYCDLCMQQGIADNTFKERVNYASKIQKHIKIWDCLNLDKVQWD